MNTPILFGWHDANEPDSLRGVKPNTVGVEVPTEEVGVRGLMVRDPYATQILKGEKVWEIRGRPTQIRGPVVIVKSGSGRAFGIANLVHVLGPLEVGDLEHAPELPEAEREEIARHGLPYPKTYAYVFRNPKWFECPIPYRHSNGAVTWVRLPDLDLGAVRYAASPFEGSEFRLV